MKKESYKDTLNYFVSQGYKKLKRQLEKETGIKIELNKRKRVK